MSSRVPEEFPPVARAFAVLLGAGHDDDDGEDEDEDEDGGPSVLSDGARCRYEAPAPLLQYSV